EATTFLQGLISNDINKISSSCAIYATLLTAQGKFLHDFFIAAAPGGDGVLIDCEGARCGDLLRRLTMYKLRAKAELIDVSTEFDVAALCGDTALSDLGLTATAGSARPFHDGVVFTDPRLAAMGARAILPANSGLASLKEEGFSPVPMAVYRRLRLEHGLPDGSRDIIVEKYFPLECGFDELNAIDYDKGCYIGQELTARTHHRGKIRKRLMPVIVDGPLPPPGTAVLLAEREVGEIRSGDADRAIALIRLEYFDTAQSGAVSFTAGDAKVIPVKPDWAKF
ncbi:MAG: folate-binding protein, partial [Proteobacteria bacterium]|nr:folate-binding protein [Pseudomonadota bacterium]